MYPYEDHIQAVKLYLKLGKRTGATILQLGYPTKNALKSWHQEYEQSRDLQAGYVRSRHKHSYEQKQAEIQYYLNYDQCIASTIKALRYPAVRRSLCRLMNCAPNFVIALSAELRTYSTPLSSRKQPSSRCAPRQAVHKPLLKKWHCVGQRCTTG